MQVDYVILCLSVAVVVSTVAPNFFRKSSDAGYLDLINSALIVGCNLEACVLCLVAVFGLCAVGLLV